MINFLINPGQRRLLICFLAVTILIAAVSGYMSELFARQFLATQIEEKIAMIGYLSEADLLQSADQIEHITVSSLLDGKYDLSQLESGRTWMAAYGYEQPDTWSFYAAHDKLGRTGFLFSFLPAAASILIISIFSYITVSSLYRHMRKLADKAQQIATDPSRTVLLGDRSSG
ncbi:MAG: hypothetical protein GX028_01585, partial [Clostridiaceae bacterium]|nr:hypothetical protein [Clostridiaceae bacterium]